MFHQLVEHCRCKTLRIGHPAPEDAATFCCWCYHFHCTAQAKFTCHSCIMLHHAASWQEGTAKPRGHADLKSDYLLLKQVLGFGNKDLQRLQRCWSTEDAGSWCYLSWKTSRKNYQISSNYKGAFSSQCVCAVLRMRLTCQVFCLISAGNMFACLILSVSLWFSFPGMSRVKVPATWLYRIRQISMSRWGARSSLQSTAHNYAKERPICLQVRHNRIKFLIAQVNAGHQPQLTWIDCDQG